MPRHPPLAGKVQGVVLDVQFEIAFLIPRQLGFQNIVVRRLIDINRRELGIADRIPVIEHVIEEGVHQVSHNRTSVCFVCYVS